MWLQCMSGLSRITSYNVCYTKLLRISKLENIEINGVFSHFAKADEFDKESAKKQFERFCSMTADLEKEGIHIPIRHISNTAAVIDLPEMNLDMVRCGIGIRNNFV